MGHQWDQSDERVPAVDEVKDMIGWAVIYAAKGPKAAGAMAMAVMDLSTMVDALYARIGLLSKGSES